MVGIRRRLEILREEASERELTPKAWWLGSHWHAHALEALGDEPQASVQGGRLVELEGLPVKLLEESPDRLALWCVEGVLDL